MMKKVVNLFILVVISFLFCKGECEFDDLPLKERKFITDHLVDTELAIKLDFIFQSLPLFIRDLFNGDEVCEQEDFIRQILIDKGFTVVVLQLKKQQIKKRKVKNINTHAVLEHYLIPGFFLKIGFDNRFSCATITRIVVADIINSFIRSKFLNFESWCFIEKKLYHRVGRPWGLFDKNYIVLSPKIEGAKFAERLKNRTIRFIFTENRKKFNNFLRTPEIEFLQCIFGVAWDCKNPCNFIISDNGIVNIDTEPVFTRSCRQIENLFYSIIGKTMIERKKE